MGEGGGLADGGAIFVVLAICVVRQDMMGRWTVLDDGSTQGRRGSLVIGKDGEVVVCGIRFSMPLPLSIFAGAAMGRQEWPNTWHFSQREGFHS